MAADRGAEGAAWLREVFKGRAVAAEHGGAVVHQFGHRFAVPGGFPVEITTKGEKEDEVVTKLVFGSLRKKKDKGDK